MDGEVILVVDHCLRSCQRRRKRCCKYNVAPNSSALGRTGVLIVAGKPFFVSQNGSQ